MVPLLLEILSLITIISIETLSCSRENDNSNNEVVVGASSVNFVMSESYPYNVIFTKDETGYDVSNDSYSDEEDFLQPGEEVGEGEEEIIVVTVSESPIYTEENEINGSDIDKIPEPYGSPGRYGGYYRDYNELRNEIVQLYEPVTAYIHGRFQKVRPDYYKHYNHTSLDKSSLGYYLGAALQRLYKQQHVRRNYTINHYYHQENPNKPQRYTSDRQLETIPPEVIIECSINAIALCPENVEPLCLRNQTIICMSIMSVVSPCDSHPEMSCVDTMVPCTSSTKKCVDHLETVSMPCLVKLIMETPKGGNLLRVSGTFIVMPETPEKERTYCAMIIAEPVLQEVPEVDSGLEEKKTNST